MKPTQPSTAVEWLINYLQSKGVTLPDEVKAEAIDRERQQTRTAYKVGKGFVEPPKKQ